MDNLNIYEVVELLCKKSIVLDNSINELEDLMLDLINNQGNDTNIVVENKLSKYNTARIDIKNHGYDKYKPNTVKITNIFGEIINYEYPEWFEDDNGKGLVIQSKNNALQLDLKCVGDGELRIWLKGEDIRLHDENIPIYINYIKFLIDGDNIINENKITCHDKPYVYKLNVKDSQKISLYLEWLPF